MRLALGAFLLTFVTAITAGLFVYHFMFSLTERMKTTFQSQPLTLEYFYINNTCITVYVRNSASVYVVIEAAYVDGEACNLIENINIAPAGTRVIRLFGTYLYGETYAVEIVPSIGPPLPQNVKYE